MLKNLRVRNYRVLNDLEIEELGRINLIAGWNNSGKTSLLEALFLLAAAGKPEWIVNANIIRLPSESKSARDADTMSLVARLWKALYSNLDTTRFIEVAADHARDGKLTLEVAPGRQRTTEISLGTTTDLPDIRSLTLKYDGPNGKTSKGHIRIKGTEFDVDIEEQGSDPEQPIADAPFSASILLSQTGSDRETAVLLGKLRSQKRGDLLLEALRVIEPNLVSVEDNSASGFPMIWCDVGLPEMVPLAVMGGGMGRLARIVLYISATAGGLVLVDEIENGFHHSVLPTVWEVIGKAAQQFDVQLFATTHSFECIRAAHESLDPDGFRLHRLEVVDSVSRCVTYEPESIGAAVRHGLEVR